MRTQRLSIIILREGAPEEPKESSLKKYKHCRFMGGITLRWLKMSLMLMLFLFFLLNSVVYPQAGTLLDYEGIKYEYHCPVEQCNCPLVICVPGFTQHNFSPEFLILKNYFREKKYNYLMIYHYYSIKSIRSRILSLQTSDNFVAKCAEIGKNGPLELIGDSVPVPKSFKSFYPFFVFS